MPWAKVLPGFSETGIEFVESNYLYELLRSRFAQSIT